MSIIHSVYIIPAVTVQTVVIVDGKGVVTMWFSSLFGFRRAKKRWYDKKLGRTLLEGDAYAQSRKNAVTKENGWYVFFGIPKEWLEILDEMDRVDNLAERKEAEHRSRSPLTESGEDENGNYIPGKLDQIAYERYTAGAATTDDRVAMIEEAIENLQPQQQEMVWAVFGEGKRRAEVAREKDVSRAAVTQSIGRIKARCAKTCESYGEPIPAKEEVKADEERMEAYQKQYEERLAKALDEWEELNEWQEEEQEENQGYGFIAV